MKIIIQKIVFLQILFYNICCCYPTSKRSRIWETVDKLTSELPNVVSLLHGRTSLSKMSWTDINSLVKSVIGEVDDISQDLGEMKEEFEDHAMGFIGVTVTLALFSALALLLLCLLAIRMRKRVAKSRGGTFPVSNLEGIRRNLQEFHRIRKMSVGEGSNHLNATNYYNPGFNTHYNQNLPLNNGPPNYAPQGSGQILPPPNNAPSARPGGS